MGYTVPNAPCGVERKLIPLLNISEEVFLMHRVELKALKCSLSHRIVRVPNAPCGVESNTAGGGAYVDFQVPNAPCGVERVV